MTVLKAQEKIAELMENSNTSKTELAKLLNQSKSHVTELLSEGRNLTLKTFARVCFHLNAEVGFNTCSIGTKYSIKKSTSNRNLKDAYQMAEIEKLLSSVKIHRPRSIHDNFKKTITSTNTYYNKIIETYKKNIIQSTKINSSYKAA